MEGEGELVYRRVLLLDGYLDEPSTLGVPPYISPYSRYLYGLLRDTGFPQEAIFYRTIDMIRGEEEALIELDCDLVLILAGTTVPGHYLGGKPISLQEIRDLLPFLSGETVLLGPITECSLWVQGIHHHAPERALTFLYTLLTGETYPRSYREGVARWSILGASLTRRHPSFPYLICEIETYRGCLREEHCLFCSEGWKKNTYTRSPEEVVAEVSFLYQEGNRYFRIGSQPDLFLYGAQQKRGGYPLPNPSFLRQLYQRIWEVAPEIKVLHMDNGSPRSLVSSPRKGQEILEIITSWNTPGDVVAMGLESADPRVLRANQIGTTVEETREAIKMVNQMGGQRREGLPLLLPGLNLLHGLLGERRETREQNLHFLQDLLDAGLLLRRINIRQLLPIKGYPRGKGMGSYAFQQYKGQINHQINRPMLQRVFPLGTILKDVLVEKVQGELSFGRQLMTYPILVGIPGVLPCNKLLDVAVVDHGFRSITALPYPLSVNRASLAQLQSLPGIGKKRAHRLFFHRPYRSFQEVARALDGDSPMEKIRYYCCLQEE